ncbi:hypothetical protein EVAR_89767_1 [Eumeta japonica]|uniref:Uncharacterized protein n=1 Tax=Eumeta variegata TaxID=151549 RepID=A0A4C1XB48_EUMVA|nr:hypothetical protein EVAR_89767_1 [Eumeta japonica]
MTTPQAREPPVASRGERANNSYFVVNALFLEFHPRYGIYSSELAVGSVSETTPVDLCTTDLSSRSNSKFPHYYRWINNSLARDIGSRRMTALPRPRARIATSERMVMAIAAITHLDVFFV